MSAQIASLAMLVIVASLWALGAEPSSEPPRFSPSKRGKELPLDGAVVRFP